MTIAAIETGHYRIELPAPLEDSTHGRMTHFELITVRLRDEDGAEGLGYSYTVGAGGGAVRCLIEQDVYRRRSADPRDRKCFSVSPGPNGSAFTGPGGQDE